MNPELHMVQELVEKTVIMTISTLAEDGRPQAAVVEFASTPNLEIIIDCYATSRKNANLKRDPRVALVIGWDKNITVQLEGTAAELSGDELDQCKQVYFAKNPRAKKWEHEPGIMYFKVTPKWIRFSDLNERPWKIKEFTL